MTEEQLNKPMTVRSLQAATRKTKEKVEGKILEVEQKYQDLEQKQVELTQDVEEAKGKVIEEGDTQVARIATEIDPKLEAISAECDEVKGRLGGIRLSLTQDKKLHLEEVLA